MHSDSEIDLDKKEIISSTLKHVKELMTGESSGHDWWHVYRVWKMSIEIAGHEKGADMFIVQLAALLHDIADWKFNEGDDKAGGAVARGWLAKVGADEKTICKVSYIVDNVSFKGAGTKVKIRGIEGKVVQDADRLDALGAIGIARAFAYGGNKNRIMYDPKIKPEYHKDFAAYKASRSTTVNHFYEKLFLLKDKMNTKTGKRIAAKRDRLMRDYVEGFLDEWDGRE